MVENPVERGGAEDSVEAVAERKRDEIGNDEPDTLGKVWPKILLRVPHHVAGKIEPDDLAARQILQENAG
jgi:hypothetical protein